MVVVVVGLLASLLAAARTVTSGGWPWLQACTSASCNVMQCFQCMPCQCTAAIGGHELHYLSWASGPGWWARCGAAAYRWWKPSPGPLPCTGSLRPGATASTTSSATRLEEAGFWPVISLPDATGGRWQGWGRMACRLSGMCLICAASHHASSAPQPAGSGSGTSATPPHLPAAASRAPPHSRRPAPSACPVRQWGVGAKSEGFKGYGDALWSCQQAQAGEPVRANPQPALSALSCRLLRPHSQPPSLP